MKMFDDFILLAIYHLLIENLEISRYDIIYEYRDLQAHFK